MLISPFLFLHSFLSSKNVEVDIYLVGIVGAHG